MAKLILVVAIMFALQMVLSGLQMKHFSNEFIKLRRQGRVVGRGDLVCKSSYIARI